MERKRDIERDVEKGLGGAGRLRILRLLLQKHDHAFTRYEIGKTVPNDPVSIRNDLQNLVQINWVTRFQVQHLSKYSINVENDVVKRLADFFKEIRYI
jgi:Fe2+ or Zn2+ uptake regulation protein